MCFVVGIRLTMASDWNMVSRETVDMLHDLCLKYHVNMAAKGSGTILSGVVSGPIYFPISADPIRWRFRTLYPIRAVRLSVSWYAIWKITCDTTGKVTHNAKRNVRRMVIYSLLFTLVSTTKKKLLVSSKFRLYFLINDYLTICVPQGQC